MKVSNVIGFTGILLLSMAPISVQTSGGFAVGLSSAQAAELQIPRRAYSSHHRYRNVRVSRLYHLYCGGPYTGGGWNGGTYYGGIFMDLRCFPPEY